MTRLFVLCMMLVSASLAAVVVAQPAPNPQATDWRKVATNTDKGRLLRWRTSFVAALVSARNEGQGDAITREGVLLEPDAGLDRPAIPAGAYLCRTIKLGRKGAYTKAFSARPPSRCVVSEEAGRMQLTTMNGAQRARGEIFPGTERRQIFLGTLSFGDETRAMAYGRDIARDMAGALERIGDRRWRLLLPQPGFESLMDVVELTPTD